MKSSKFLVFFTLCLLAAFVIGLVASPYLSNLYRDISFHWTDHTETEYRVKDHADQHGIPYSSYPASLIELLERNPETEDFVLNYPFRQDLPIDLSATESRDTVPLFLQWDPRWGYDTYGSDCIGITGCGPTCLAMAGYYLTGDEFFSPDQVARFAEENGYYSPGNGSSWTLISQGGPELGLDVTEIPLVQKRIVDNVKVGNPIILALGPGDFTTTGHYVVIVGMEDGKFRVNDPNSIANSQRLWSYQELEPQIRNLWVIRRGTGR